MAWLSSPPAAGTGGLVVRQTTQYPRSTLTVAPQAGQVRTGRSLNG